MAAALHLAHRGTFSTLNGYYIQVPVGVVYNVSCSGPLAATIQILTNIYPYYYCKYYTYIRSMHNIARQMTKKNKLLCNIIFFMGFTTERARRGGYILFTRLLVFLAYVWCVCSLSTHRGQLVASPLKKRRNPAPSRRIRPSRICEKPSLAGFSIFQEEDKKSRRGQILLLRGNNSLKS